jgi:hypothetical protein
VDTAKIPGQTATFAWPISPLPDQSFFMSDPTPELFDPAKDYEARTPRGILARYGYAPLRPSELTACLLPGRLWELLHAAAARRFFFCFSDHLDDRALYTALWEQWP